MLEVRRPFGGVQVLSHVQLLIPMSQWFVMQLSNLPVDTERAQNGRSLSRELDDYKKSRKLGGCSSSTCQDRVRPRLSILYHIAL